MKNDSPQEDLNSKPDDTERLSDDLRIVRSALEKSYKMVKPETHDMVMWGLICATAYIGIHFLHEYSLQKWTSLFYLSLMGLGMCGSLVTMFFWIRRQKKKGFVPKLPFQVAGVLIVIVFPIIVLDRMGMFKDVFGGAGFIYAMGISMFMGIYGILYSKAGFLGEAIILAGMLTAFFAKGYWCPMIILGLATGTGIITTALIAEINHRRWEENA